VYIVVGGGPNTRNKATTLAGAADQPVWARPGASEHVLFARSGYFFEHNLNTKVDNFWVWGQKSSFTMIGNKMEVFLMSLMTQRPTSEAN
jgi:hypothetical protein